MPTGSVPFAKVAVVETVATLQVDVAENMEVPAAAIFVPKNKFISTLPEVTEQDTAVKSSAWFLTVKIFIFGSLEVVPRTVTPPSLVSEGKTLSAVPSWKFKEEDAVSVPISPELEIEPSTGMPNRVCAISPLAKVLRPAKV